jgi:hypothetical protein
MTYQEARKQINEVLNDAGITISMGEKTTEELVGCLNDLVQKIMNLKRNIRQEGVDS